MPATGRRLSFRARPLRAGAAPRVARAPCRAVDTPLICASQMRALRLPLGTWQRARRCLATDPTQTCWAGGAPGAPRRNAGGTPASEGTGSRTTWVCLCPAAGPSGTVSGGRELRVESLAGGARAMGPGRIPLSCEPREEGERREKEKERDGGTEHEAAWRRPGARAPDSSWSVTSQATPVSSPGKINPGSSPCTHRVSTAKPLTPRSPGPPSFHSLAGDTFSSRPAGCPIYTRPTLGTSF